VKPYPPSSDAKAHTLNEVKKMATRIDAIYEHGVFRPTEPVELAEGERVQIVVFSSGALPSASAAARILAEIAALPLETPRVETASRDHDRYLYGHPEA
jgi:predicted DNA-binding antitoxin AbrB/MazE fold protein